MKIWFALIGTPLIALTNLTIVYALATPACQSQSRGWLHAVTAVSLAVCIVATIAATKTWLVNGGLTGVDSDRATGSFRFLCALSSMTGVLFSLAVIGQWIAIFILSPCL